MTYNIHKCIGGVDRRYQPERIVETIAHYAPDVVLLQEVDDGAPRSRRDRQIDLLGDSLGFEHRAYQANVRLKYGVYGNSILSRWPLQETHDVDLTIWPKKRRRAQVVKLHVSEHAHPDSGYASTRTVIVANVHLGLAAFERRRQLRMLLAHETLAHARRRTATIVAGDFNDLWQNLGNGHLGRNQFQSALDRVKTFPAVLPLRRLDGIYHRGDLRVVRGFVGHTELSKQASDHLPAIAEFSVGSAQSPIAG